MSRIAVIDFTRDLVEIDGNEESPFLKSIWYMKHLESLRGGIAVNKMHRRGFLWYYRADNEINMYILTRHPLGPYPDGRYMAHP